MRVLWTSASALALLLLVACSGSDTWLEDRAGLLDEEQAEALNNYHRHLLADHGIDYRMVIEEGEEDINRRAVKLFESIGVGDRSEGGRGLLLVLDPEQDQVRIEVSQALEGVYPDALISYLERRQMVPFFRRGRVADGIVATTELIVKRAQEAAENKAFDPSTLPAATGGAGATTEAEVGAGDERHNQSGGPDVAAGEDPGETVRAYLEAMARRDDRPDLGIYTEQTREMLADWTVTPAQMDNIVNTYRDCGDGEVLESSDGGFAVVRYGIDERQCAPWFLRNHGDGWKLDLAVQQKAVGFGRSNAWHLNPRTIHRYQFGFMDWQLDGNGYPQSEQQLRWGLQTTTTDRGTFVTAVQPGSAAERFGFRWGDRLVEWNGESVQDHRHALQFMQQAEAGAPQTIAIQRRNGRAIRLQGAAPE